MIKVMLVDDHELIRAGIKRLLDDADNIDVIAEADCGEAAIDKVRKQKIDVVLMDVNMPGIGGLEATRKLTHIDPELRVIVVTVHASEPFPTRLLEAGAAGYLTKDCGQDEIIKAIYAVNRGDRYIGNNIAQKIALSMLPGSSKSPFDLLSQREMQVMLMIIQGQSSQEVSDRLCLSPKTISTYRHRLFEKLHVVNDVELTRLAIVHGITDSGLSA